ncbi:hypothetical protein TSUD_382760 [Trifolium subterraneum]|uniref:Transmembrane protein n=1 Tax=Trifolium subterraneum TaxID=3900 RepID=A0A2Z6NYH3_TRISU|nr:hypothetical protein TSUD_382760 [Trifolium subterraneum]
MANLNQPFNTILTTLSFLFFLMISQSHTASSSSISSSSSHSSNNNKDMIKSQNPSSVNTELSHYHQVFYLKNTDHPSMFLNRQERIKKMRMNRNKNKNMMKKQSKQRKQRKKIVKNMMKSPKPFSVMLPKGFVPPSGSSPCHNDQPNSVNSFHCYLASTEP